MSIQLNTVSGVDCGLQMTLKRKKSSTSQQKNISYVDSLLYKTVNQQKQTKQILTFKASRKEFVNFLPRVL